MNVKEWALIVFTILAQMSVGAFLVLGVVHLYATKKSGAEEADRLSDRALLAIIVTLGLGLFASLFHLGNPFSAPRAISHVATSWLSREIAFGCGFALLGVIFAGMQWFKIATFAVRNVIAWLAAIVGVGLIYCMSRAYMLPTQPSWNTIATPISFYATALLLGALAMGVAFFLNYRYITAKHPDCADCQAEMLREVLSWLAVLAIAMLGVEFIIIPIYVAILGTGSATAVASLKLMLGTYGFAFVLRLVLAFVGVAVFGVFMYKNAKQAGQLRMLGTLATSAFVLALAAELIGRFLFYATHIGISNLL